MTIAYYCTEGQSEASITINGVTYKTINPPLIVETRSDAIQKTVYTVRLVNGLTYQQILPELEEGYYSALFIPLFQQNITQVAVDITVRGISLPAPYYIMETYPFKGSSTPYNPLGAESASIGFITVAGTKISDSTEQIASIEGYPDYTINCDGCEEGECKGNKSRYPGYDCLDCAKLQRQLKLIGRKIDGVTKR